ncbi:transcription elongation factor S-II [Cunninghamella echinulata]|nr:transcription elongation factor S-II [Cunninghamella echinulata]
MSVEHDLLKAKNALQKAIDAENTKDALDIMTQLASIKATHELLKKTDIGKVLGRLRSHSDAKVAQRAKGIVKKWKDDVTNPASTPTVKKPTISTQSSQASSTASSPKTPTQDNTIRTVKTDGVKIRSTGNTPRDKTIELMYNAIAFDSNVHKDLLLERATAIERTVFDNIGQVVNEEYKSKIRSLTLNLKSKSNPGLRQSTVSGELAISKLCKMSVEDMASEESKARDRQLAEEALFKARGAGTAQAETDMFICGKCKQRRCTYFQMQTRSADEPMTTFVTCINCGNRWKFC